MKSGINRDFYCLYDYAGTGRCNYGNAAVYGEGDAIEERNRNCRKGRCGYYRHKLPTPEEYRAEYRTEYLDDGAVYSRNSGWGWGPETFRQAKKRLETVPETQIVCACTPWGAPPADWRPE